VQGLSQQPRKRKAREEKRGLGFSERVSLDQRVAGGVGKRVSSVKIKYYWGGGWLLYTEDSLWEKGTSLPGSWLRKKRGEEVAKPN